MEGPEKNQTSDFNKMENKTKVTIQELIELLECPVCYQNTKLESYIQCRNGHHGCTKCFNKLKTCPMCRVALKCKIKSFSPEVIKIAKKELKHAQSFDSQKILDIFKCTVCCNVPTAKPVWQCTKGHIKCESCYHYFVRACPLCFEKRIFSRDRQKPSLYKSQITEKILEKVVKCCRFKVYGCKEVIVELGNHETNVCIYRLENYIQAMLDYVCHLESIHKRFHRLNKCKCPYLPN